MQKVKHKVMPKVMPKVMYGFTLVELMIVVAIIGIISAIALPLYNDYISTSREGALVTSMSTIEVFQEDLFMRTGAYGAGTWDQGVDESLLANVGWSPRSDKVKYVAVLVGATAYTVTATDATGYVTCRQFPGAALCP